MVANPLGLFLSLTLFNPAVVRPAVVRPAVVNVDQPTLSAVKATQSINPEAPQLIAKTPVDPNTGFPIVDGKKWDKEGPWFQPVLVQDAAGTYVAVLDKQKQGDLKLPELLGVDKLGAFTNWSRQGIQVKGNSHFQVCFFLVLCSTSYPRMAVEDIEVKVDDQVFHPQREGDKFVVDDELAQALSVATPGKAWTRLFITPGVTITLPVSDDTVKAWPKVFQGATVATGIQSVPVGGGSLSPTTGKSLVVEPFPSIPKNTPSSTFMTDPKTGLPLINGSTWRSGKHVALSRVAMVRDEFDGEYKAVLHKDGGFRTLWSRGFVDVFATSRVGTILSFYSVPSLHITAGDRTLNLYGVYNRFPINEMSARFLQQAGEKMVNEEPTIHYFVGDGNEKKTYKVDVGTAKSWATLYRE